MGTQNPNSSNPNSENPAPSKWDEFARQLRALQAEHQTAWADWDDFQIARYLAKACGDEESQRIEEMVEAHPAMRQAVEQIQQVMGTVEIDETGRVRPKDSLKDPRLREEFAETLETYWGLDAETICQDIEEFQSQSDPESVRQFQAYEQLFAELPDRLHEARCIASFQAWLDQPGRQLLYDRICKKSFTQWDRYLESQLAPTPLRFEPRGVADHLSHCQFCRLAKRFAELEREREVKGQLPQAQQHLLHWLGSVLNEPLREIRFGCGQLSARLLAARRAAARDAGSDPQKLASRGHADRFLSSEILQPQRAVRSAHRESERKLLSADKVLAWDLGIEIYRNGDPHGFDPIIPRNTIYPTGPNQFRQTYLPTSNQQRELRIPVFQGQSPTTTFNACQGIIKHTLSQGIPLGTPIQIAFQLDAQGLLKIDLSIEGFADESQTFQLDRNEPVLSETERDPIPNWKESLKNLIDVGEHFLRECDRYLTMEDKKNLNEQIQQARACLASDDRTRAEPVGNAISRALSGSGTASVLFLAKQAQDMAKKDLAGDIARAREALVRASVANKTAEVQRLSNHLKSATHQVFHTRQSEASGPQPGQITKAPN